MTRVDSRRLARHRCAMDLLPRRLRCRSKPMILLTAFDGSSRVIVNFAEPRGTPGRICDRLTASSAQTLPPSSDLLRNPASRCGDRAGSSCALSSPLSSQLAAGELPYSPAIPSAPGETPRRGGDITDLARCGSCGSPSTARP
jgi:hypothetical protein